MLRIENISKSYGDKSLFTNINTTIGEFERIGLIGVNGTGKSSFLKVIAGIDEPDQEKLNTRRIIRLNILHRKQCFTKI